jgi:hypothetical protein
MPLDPLQELLRRADADAGPVPRLRADLPGRVMSRARRAQERTALAGSVAAALLLAIGVMTFLRTTAPSEPAAVEAVERRLTADVAALQREADSRATIARRFAELRERDERLAALQAEATRPDPVQRAQQEVDQTAFVLLQQGDHLYRDLGLKERAADSYRRTARLFPETRWAGLARQRLEEMETDKGDTL